MILLRDTLLLQFNYTFLTWGFKSLCAVQSALWGYRFKSGEDVRMEIGTRHFQLAPLCDDG